MIRANSRLIKVLINVILVLLLSLIPLTWYKNEALIVIPERHIPLNPLGDFQRSLFLWDWSCGGRYSRQLFLKLPYLTLLALGRIIGMSPVTIQKLSYISFFALAGLSMIYLIYAIIKDERRYIAGIVASIF